MYPFAVATVWLPVGLVFVLIRSMVAARNERRREAYLAERDLDELLEATNARRRSKGLSERTRENVRREFGFDHNA